MKHLASIVFIFSLFCTQTSFADDKVVYGDVTFLKYEIPFYSFAEFTPQVALRMEYAKFEVLNNDDWARKSKRNQAYEIDLVFTKYPKEISRWRTNYRQLLLDRLESLFALDSTLRNPDIKWNLILQTQCDTEDKAKEYFHGFVIKYRPRKIPTIERVTDSKQLRALVSGKITTKDSTVFKVMDRNPQWNNMLVVMDWTGSMYKHGAQLVIWHKLNQSVSGAKVNHFVFFNDGNNKKTWQKRMGKTGGVYRSKTGDLEEIVETMEYVMKKGNGGDPEENDLEAILTGLQYLDGFDDVILIADNKSEVRDLELLSEINKPVRIILCDYRGKIHPHYKEIADKTGGSIHTLERDLYRKAQ
ncbi:MAG: hypothetical protein AAFR87_26470 [Bacteroidota bacterium]